MITLHESNITSFPLDNGIGVLSDAIKAFAEEELNGLFEFEMEYDSEGFLVDELKEERIIKAKAQDKLGYQLFRIYSITKNHENDNLIIKAQHITYDLANNFVKELNANNMTKQQVMKLIGSSAVTPHAFNLTSPNNTTRSSTKLYRTNPLQMIGGMQGSILQIWGGQIERDNFNLIMHDRRGHDDGVKVTYEKNITGLEAVFDISNVITRIFPFVFKEEKENEPEKLMTISGEYVDSPLINDYDVIRTQPIDFSDDERINIDGTDEQIRTQLTNLAHAYFDETGNDKAKVELGVQFAHLWETEEYKNVAPLELVGMGDTVGINHSKLKVDATAIVNYIRYDCIAEINEEVKLGSVKARLSDSVSKFDGKTKTYWGPDEPTEGMSEGDLWFKIVDNDYTRTYRYDGIEWQLIVDMDSQQAKVEAQQAKNRAEEAYDNANIATQNAIESIGIAQEGFDKAQDALLQSGQAIDRSTQAFDRAQEGFDLAQENATEIDSLALRMTDAEGNYTSISGTVQGLQTRVSNSENQITSLTQTAEGLQTEVNKKVDTGTYNSKMTQLDNLIGTKVSQTDADGRYTQQTEFNQFADRFSTRVTEIENWEIGGRNLSLNSEKLTGGWGNGYQGSVISYQQVDMTDEWGFPEAYRMRASGGTNIIKAVRNSHQDMNLSEALIYENSYVYSLYVKNMGENVIELYMNGFGGQQTISLNPNQSIRYISYGTRRVQYDWFQAIFRTLEANQSVDVIVGREKLEKGNKVTEWTPAPEDTDQKFSAINQDIDSISTRVQTTENNYSSMSQTVQGIQNTVADKADKSTVTQLSNLLNTTITNKADKSEVTQLATLVDTKVTSSQVNSLIASDKRIKDTRSDNQLPSWYFENYNRQTAREFKSLSAVGITTDGAFGVLETEVPWGDISGGQIKQTLYTDVATYERRSNGASAWQVWKKIADVDYVEGRITVLNNAINLRVTKNELINEINIDTSGILISGKKLILDGDTTVTGTFRVKNANIESVDAGKMTTGTLNAAQVSIINLNASNITSGKVSAVYIDADKLSAITAKTGALEVTEDITLSQVNRGIYMSYSNMDVPTGGSVQRLMTGDGRLAKHNLRFTGRYLQDGQGWRNADTLIGLDHVLLREYFRNSDGSNGNVAYRTDFTASKLFMTNVGGGISNPQQYTKLNYDNLEIKNYNEHAFYRGNMTRIDGPEYSIEANTGEAFFRFINGASAKIVRSTRIYQNQSSASGGLPVYITPSANNLFVATSSEKFKINIERGARASDYNILNVPIARWNDKKSMELYAELLAEEAAGKYVDWEKDERALMIESLKKSVGVIAEDLHDAGLNDYVIYTDSRRFRQDVLTIDYSRLTVPLMAVAQKHEDEITTLKQHNETLTNQFEQAILKIADLEERLFKAERKLTILEAA